jgi:hypothetical protein
MSTTAKEHKKTPLDMGVRDVSPLAAYIRSHEKRKVKNPSRIYNSRNYLNPGRQIVTVVSNHLYPPNGFAGRQTYRDKQDKCGNRFCMSDISTCATLVCDIGPHCRVRNAGRQCDVSPLLWRVYLRGVFS